jgi:hypothetical protein
MAFLPGVISLESGWRQSLGSFRVIAYAHAIVEDSQGQLWHHVKWT